MEFSNRTKIGMKKLNKIIEQINKAPLNVKILNFSEMYDLHTLPDGIGKCINLENLDVSATAIKNIPNSIISLPKLKHISFFECKELEKFPNLSSSKTIERVSCEISGILDFSNLFETLTIKSLTISGNVEEISDDIKKLKELEELVIYGTKIRRLPISITKCEKLKCISINQKLFRKSDIPIMLDLVKIFDVLTRQGNIKELNLDSNKLKEIPSSIGSIKSLQKLSLKKNDLEDIPEEIFELKNLTELDLGINKLKKIPKGINKLEKLKVLKLNSNWKNKINFQNLYSCIGSLKQLTELELWACESSEEIPEEISLCAKLKNLDISKNKIKTLPDKIFEMSHLKKLRLTDNNMPDEFIKELKEKLSDTKIY